MPNRLIHEKSPYLLQHAHNPVDWYAWGDSAFEKARREDKPILVSIGYSTCHWCHVMEQESYEDPAVAALMNQYLVNIKVDREERPDVDKIYMSAVSAMTGSGGWPLNVFITPDLKPIFGGTYFPPRARWGQPAWGDVVKQIGVGWHDKTVREQMLASSDRLTQALREFAATTSAPLAGDPAWLDQAFHEYDVHADKTFGGFGPAPKFPMPVSYQFLLRYYARTKNQAALDLSLHTLREMAKGGIYDHLGGGFARYSTDARWHVPHFEKMLYDNAQLASVYVDAYHITRDERFAGVARDTLDYIRRDMTHPDGGFYSAEDADSLLSAGSNEKREGAFYVWKQSDVLAILGEALGSPFCFRYGVRLNGNATQDPHGEFKGKNILYLAHPVAEVAASFKVSVDEMSKRLENARRLLFEARLQRPRPHLDDKILSGWNGLMLSAYAKAFVVMGRDTDRKSAQKAARFLRAHLYEPSTRLLYRRWRDGERRILGTADDYAFLVQGLLDLYEADFNAEWLEWAITLQESLHDQFFDSTNGGFFMTAQSEKDLLMRIKEDQDNVEPAASSVAALNALRLAQRTDRRDFQTMAEKTLQGFGETMRRSPRALPQMLVALDFFLTEPRHVVLAGSAETPGYDELLKTIRDPFLPVKTLLVAEPRQEASSASQAFTAGMQPIDGKAAAYVCIKHTCQNPTTDPAVLSKLLSAF